MRCRRMKRWQLRRQRRRAARGSRQQFRGDGRCSWDTRLLRTVSGRERAQCGTCRRRQVARRRVYHRSEAACRPQGVRLMKNGRRDGLLARLGAASAMAGRRPDGHNDARLVQPVRHLARRSTSMDAQGRTQKVALVSRHRCTPDGRVHIVGRIPRAGRSDHGQEQLGRPCLRASAIAYFARGGESRMPIASPRSSSAMRGTGNGRSSRPRRALVRRRKARRCATRRRDGDQLRLTASAALDARQRHGRAR